MASRHLRHLVVVGGGAAGLLTARELARAGRQVTLLEARERLGGRIYPLPAEEFGYPAEGGAEFIHGAAPVTRLLMREGGLSLLPRHGTRWRHHPGGWRADDWSLPHEDAFYRALAAVTVDLPIAEFLATRFAETRYDELRRRITRTVEGYDAADPHRASTLALREEWLARDDGEGGRIAEGYGALIAHLASDCRKHGVALQLGAEVAAIAEAADGIEVRCRGGAAVATDAAVLTVPPPILAEIALPEAARARVAAAADIGFGNVVKILLRFERKWWADHGGRDMADLSFVISDARVPTWWSQQPSQYPVLTGWFAGPRAERVSDLDEPQLVEMGLAALAEIFAQPLDRLRRDLVAARAINWGADRFARGAYSYATPGTRAAQRALSRDAGDAIFFAGEALHAGPDIGTVEAALAGGRRAAQMILAAARD